ncbi:tyrosine-type recombinase/integrase [Clostridium butyricum]|uniref:Tyrosine-type recombinase/integrase n=1 Tax=Clostridium butyricum TaxID=1492 RepID=A0A6L9ENG4_CLOBU|nr:tyrosine-type recombinase/integrase [Clostridium butyricum]
MELEYNVTYRQKDKGIQAIISYKDNTGKWKQKSKQGFKTQREAKPVVMEIVNQIKEDLLNENTIINADYKYITFKELAENFIEHSKLYREPATVRSYKNAFAKFQLINDIKVHELKKINITKCIDEMLKQNILNDTILTYLKRIKLFFDYYRENYDPNFTIDLTFKLTHDKGTAVKKKALTNEKLNSLLNSEKLLKSKYYIVAYMSAKCGLRCSEVLGLTWDDIDRKNLVIKINKQWKKNKDNQFNFGTLKSKNSYREVPISPNVLNFLDKYKQKNPIHLNERIAPFSYDCINTYLNPILRDLADISIHELRHTYITMLISKGIDFKTVATIAGHDVKQTLSTYSHVTDDMMKSAHDIISQIL